MYYFALAVFWGKLGAVISSTCCDDDLRRSVFLDANSTYARVLLYASANRKILIPTKLGVENARLAFFYSSARHKEKMLSAWIPYLPGRKCKRISAEQVQSRSLNIHFPIFTIPYNLLINLHCCGPAPYITLPNWWCTDKQKSSLYDY